LNLALAEGGSDWDDDGAKIHAGKIEYGQFAAVGDYHADAGALLQASAVQLRSKGASLDMKFAVGELTTGNGIDQEDAMLVMLDNLCDGLTNGHCHCMITVLT
jgi:hypothetical protein